LVYLFSRDGQIPSGNLELLKVGLFLAGFFTVSQFSFLGNYLPRMYPDVSARHGRKLLGKRRRAHVGIPPTLVTTQLADFTPSDIDRINCLRSGGRGFSRYALACSLSFWLPERSRRRCPNSRRQSDRIEKTLAPCAILMSKPHQP